MELDEIDYTDAFKLMFNNKVEEIGKLQTNSNEYWSKQSVNVQEYARVLGTPREFVSWAEENMIETFNFTELNAKKN